MSDPGSTARARDPDDQTETIAFLSSPRAFGSTAPVETVETHGAIVFLSGTEAIKLKRSVVYDYMDLGTPEKRHAMLLRELELNAPEAPSIYRDVVAVTRGTDGRLALNGTGDPVDWVLRMRRFRKRDELTEVARRGDLDDRLATALGHRLAGYHARAPRRDASGPVLIRDIIDELERVFSGLASPLATEAHRGWVPAARRALGDVSALLVRRARGGSVRRGHGDLHLGNLVLVDGAPVPFDALEFDEVLGTCDLLYDLAFLLMDLCHRDLARAGCRVLDAWLLDFRGGQDGGLRALPLFLSLRAAIRAMVLMQTDRATRHPGRSDTEASRYLRDARAYLEPPPAALVAVGGLSGTGKSVLSRALAPLLGPAPGAVWLATDVLRKADAPEPGALPPAAYAEAARQAVYRTAFGRAKAILGAGHAVILDATFMDAGLRLAAEETARAAGRPFAGLWLQAPEKSLRERVAGRTGDASDAGIAVLEHQLATPTGPITWHRIDAAGSETATLEAARPVLKEVADGGD